MTDALAEFQEFVAGLDQEAKAEFDAMLFTALRERRAPAAV
jgi:hypothetical protein